MGEGTSQVLRMDKQQKSYSIIVVVWHMIPSWNIIQLCRYVILGCHAWSITRFCHPNQLLERWESETCIRYRQRIIQLSKCINTSFCTISASSHDLSFCLLAWMDGSRSSPQWKFKWEVSITLLAFYRLHLLAAVCDALSLISHLSLSMPCLVVKPQFHNNHCNEKLFAGVMSIALESFYGSLQL